MATVLIAYVISVARSLIYLNQGNDYSVDLLCLNLNMRIERQQKAFQVLSNL